LLSGQGGLKAIIRKAFEKQFERKKKSIPSFTENAL
jgi:hypothetical protein